MECSGEIRLKTKGAPVIMPTFHNSRASLKSSKLVVHWITEWLPSHPCYFSGLTKSGVSSPYLCGLSAASDPDHSDLCIEQCSSKRIFAYNTSVFIATFEVVQSMHNWLYYAKEEPALWTQSDLPKVIQLFRCKEIWGQNFHLSEFFFP